MAGIPLPENYIPYQGAGYPLNPNDANSYATPWGRFARNQNLGKSAVLFYDANNAKAQSQPIPLLSLTGDDCDAQQLIITLGTPKAIAEDPAVLATRNQGAQNLTGEQDNFAYRQREAAGVPFPGTPGPIAWPQLEAIIEWGVGGVNFMAVVDFVNGMTVNLTASFVRVHARVAPTQRSGQTGTTAYYTLSAFAGPGVNTTRTAQKTVYVGTVGGASQATNAKLALGEAMGIGNMVLQVREAGTVGNGYTFSVAKDFGAGAISIDDDAGNIVLTLPEANQDSQQVEDCINTSALVSVFSSDSDPGNLWANVTGGPFDFAGGIDGDSNESGVFSLPRFAKQARLVGINNGANPPLTVGTIRFWTSPDGAAGGSNVGNFFFSGNNNAPCEIPNGAMYFSVVNAETDPAEFAVVFDLTL